MDSEVLLQNAKNLRRNMTEAEKRLWNELRAKRFEGFKFRRQHLIGRYIVDFACLQGRVIIEVDGGQHNESIYDQKRDAWLKEAGFDVLRFWNNEVMENREGVLTAIQSALTPSQPSP